MCRIHMFLSMQGLKSNLYIMLGHNYYTLLLPKILEHKCTKNDNFSAQYMNKSILLFQSLSSIFNIKLGASFCRQNS